MKPTFAVPAEYFYALDVALPTDVTAKERFDMGLARIESDLVRMFEKAIGEGLINMSDDPANPGQKLEAIQAARRLRAIGNAAIETHTVEYDPTILKSIDKKIDEHVRVLLLDWLSFKGDDLESFWADAAKAHSATHLALVLLIISKGHKPLVDAFAPIVTSSKLGEVKDLEKYTVDDWRSLVILPPSAHGGEPKVDRIPPFAQSGSIEDRFQTFVRHVRKFVAVDSVLVPPMPLYTFVPPSFPNAPDSPLEHFANEFQSISGAPPAYGSSAGGLPDPPLTPAIRAVFPGDPEAQDWLAQAVKTIDELYFIASHVTTPPIPPAELQSSIVESLYARGFTSKDDVAALRDWRAFQDALTGTVAYEYARGLYVAAGGTPHPAPTSDAFAPVNDGSLINCIPPAFVSPLGGVAYLHDLLGLSEASTCSDPWPKSSPKLQDILAVRRGLLSALKVSAANLETPIPLTDLVNESLERIVADNPAPPSGVVYDTAELNLAGHIFADHDPATLFRTLPQYSTPATPVAKPNAYVTLRSDFSAPALPYPQPLDVCRTYLDFLHSSRFAVMRRFRKDITEFVFDPLNEPTDFLRYLWRYPVRIDIGREYLNVTAEEHELLFTKAIVDTPTAGCLLLRELFGFEADLIDGTAWTSIVVKVSEFLQRTGLTYCQLLELQRSHFEPFQIIGMMIQGELPNCEPCYLDKLTIRFTAPVTDALRRLAVFIRLWRQLRGINNAAYSFETLTHICAVLKLFTPNINPDFLRQLVAFQMLRDDFDLPLVDDPHDATVSGADPVPLLSL